MPIRNHHEYRLTKSEAEKFEHAVAVERQREPGHDVDPRLHQAMIESLESELAVLRAQLDDYERRDADR